MKNTDEINTNWNLFLRLSGQVVSKDGDPFEFEGQTWDHQKYFNLLGQLKKACDRLEYQHPRIYELYEKYKSYITIN